MQSSSQQLKNTNALPNNDITNISNHIQAIVVLLLMSASLAIMMVLELPPRLSFSSQVKTESL